MKRHSALWLLVVTSLLGLGATAQRLWADPLPKIAARISTSYCEALDRLSQQLRTMARTWKLRKLHQPALHLLSAGAASTVASVSPAERPVAQNYGDGGKGIKKGQALKRAQEVAIGRGALEERLIDAWQPEAKPRSVEGTLGATGPAWPDLLTLLVAVGAPEPAPGLCRNELLSSERTLGFRTEPAHSLAAPLPLPSGLVAVVDSHRSDQPKLLLPRGGAVQHEVLMIGPVHQLFGTDSRGHRVRRSQLQAGGLTLFAEFLQDLFETSFDEGSTMRGTACSSALGVVEYQDIMVGDEDELLLVDAQRKPARELVVSSGHDQLPAWRADGNELRYLGRREDERRSLR